MARSVVLISDHIQPIVDHLDTTMGALAVPVAVGFGERPKKSDKDFYPPPYIVVTYVMGGGLDGPLSDSQADITLRVAIVCMGNTASEATILRDISHAEMMDKTNFVVTGRKVRDIRVEIPSDGTYRDDDVSTPIFYTRQIYLMDTTPA